MEAQKYQKALKVKGKRQSVKCGTAAIIIFTRFQGRGGALAPKHPHVFYNGFLDICA